jgi:uncharacterized membrane protein
MKKIFIYLFVAIIAIILVVVNIMNYDPKTETWSSVLLGAGVGFLIVKLPSIVAYFKGRQQKSVK